jgi:hypothetical protein
MRCAPAGSVAVVYADGESECFAGAALQAAEAGSDSAAAEAERGCSKGLQLLGRGLRWLRADVFGDFEVMADLVAPHARMFGVEGAGAVVAFKRRWLNLPVNYNVDAIHEFDPVNRVLVAGFDCLLVGKEGRGTDVVQFTDAMLVSEVAAIRHTSVSPPNVES